MLRVFSEPRMASGTDKLFSQAWEGGTDRFFLHFASAKHRMGIPNKLKPGS